MRGFSLLETVIAIAILVAAILGPLTLASSSIRLASLAKNNLTAATLAEEGIDLIRTTRGNSLIAGSTWDSWIMGLQSGDCFAAAGCRIDAQNSNVESCIGFSCVLNLDGDLYTYASGNPSAFTRKINIVEIAPGVEVRVKSTVSWRDRFGIKSFELTEQMLNWQ